MTRVMIPFADPERARQAVAQLLDEARDPQLHVHLVAAVEPLLSGKVRIFVSPQRAEAAVRDAGSRWLEPLMATLAAAGVPATSEVIVGPVSATIREATLREGVDRVLLPVERHETWRSRDHGGQPSVSTRRVTLVA